MSKEPTDMTDRTPPPWQNERATGARKFTPRPDLENPDITHTGDRGDEPRVPYGLTEPTSDRDDATRHHDGTQMSVGAQSAAGGKTPRRRPV